MEKKNQNHRRFFHRLRGKPYGLFVPVIISFICILALVIAIIVYNYTQNVESIKKSIENYNLQIGNEIKRTVDDKINMSIQKLYDFCYDKRVLKFASVRNFYDPSGILSALDVISLSNSACITHRQIENVFLYFANTDIILDRNAYFTQKDYYANMADFEITSEQWAQLLQSDEDFHFLIAPVPNRDLLILKSIPFTGLAKTMVQVGVRLSGDEFANVLNSLSTINSMNAYIISDTGEVISWTRNAPETDGLLSEFSSMSPGIHYIDVNKAKYLITLSKSAYCDWNYITVVPATSFMRDLTSFRILTGIIVLVILTLFVFLILFVKRKSIEPVKTLVDTIRQKNLTDDTVHSNEVQIISQTLEHLTREREEIKKSMAEQYPVIKNNLLLSLLKEIEIDSNIPGKMAEMGIQFSHETFMVLCVDIEEAPEFQTIHLDERILIKTIITNIAQDVFRLVGEIQVAAIDWDKMVMLVNSEKDAVDMNKMVYECALEYTHLLKSLFSLIVTIGISTCGKGIKSVGSLYREAEEAIAGKLVSGINSINQFRNTKYNVNNYFYPTYMEHKLINSVAAGNEAQALDILRTIFDSNFKGKTYPVKYSKCLFFDIISTVLKLLNEIRIDYSDIFEEQFDTDTKLLECKTVDEMHQVVSTIVVKICRYVKSKAKSKNDKLIQDIIDYIHANYCDRSICIASISDQMEITQTYLSHYFKEKMGCTVMKYIEQLRIDKVKELLGTGMTLADITNETGFSNSAVLIRTFKKIEGITPGQFREIK